MTQINSRNIFILLFLYFIPLASQKITRMKNLLVLLVIVSALRLPAQDAGKIFGSSTVIWYGIDFTKAKVLGFGDESPHKIRDEYFKAWNDVTIDIDLAKVFQKMLPIKIRMESAK